MESYVLTGQNKEGIIIYQSRVYFDFEKVIQLRSNVEKEFSQSIYFIC